MWHSPSVFACQAASPSCTTSPVRCTAKSTIVVVPPIAAALVPVSNVSLADVPPNGISMCVWASIPPGITYLPPASITSSAVIDGVNDGSTTATIFSPSTRTSATFDPVGPTTVPPLMSKDIFATPL